MVSRTQGILFFSCFFNFNPTFLQLGIQEFVNLRCPEYQRVNNSHCSACWGVIFECSQFFSSNFNPTPQPLKQQSIKKQCELLSYCTNHLIYAFLKLLSSLFLLRIPSVPNQFPSFMLLISGLWGYKYYSTFPLKGVSS